MVLIAAKCPREKYLTLIFDMKSGTLTFWKSRHSPAIPEDQDVNKTVHINQGEDYIVLRICI